MRMFPITFSLALLVGAATTCVAQSLAPVPVVRNARPRITLHSSNNQTPLDRVRGAQEDLEIAIAEAEKTVPQGWFSVNTVDAARTFWNAPGAKSLTSAALISDLKEITANIDLASDVVYVVRLSLGSTVSAGADNNDSQDEHDAKTAATRLLQGGGTVYVNAAYPIYFRQSSDLTSGTAIMLYGTAGWDSPNLGGLIDSPGATGSLLIDASGRYGGASGILGVEGALQARVAGFNSHFAERLKTTTNGGAIAGVRIGVVLLNKTRFGLNIPFVHTTAFESGAHTTAFVQQVVSF